MSLPHIRQPIKYQMRSLSIHSGSVDAEVLVVFGTTSTTQSLSGRRLSVQVAYPSTSTSQLLCGVQRVDATIARSRMDELLPVQCGLHCNFVSHKPRSWMGVYPWEELSVSILVRVGNLMLVPMQCLASLSLEEASYF